jgi:acetolactate synthase I/II/III large subunit
MRDIPYVPGGPIMPFVQAAHETGLLRFVLCRHEQGAGFIAEGQARVLRRTSAVLVTAGPGVTNLVTPIYVAQCEMTPMLVISAQVSRHMNGKGAAQELDTVELLRPLTKRSVALSDPIMTRALLRSLLKEAQAPRCGPVHLSIASDLWLQEVT